MANNQYNSSQPNTSTWIRHFGVPPRLSNGSKWSNADQARRSAKVAKVSSGHKSPRGIERRRTTTSVRYHPTLEQHYCPMFDEEASGGYTGNSLQRSKMVRPVSWHPSSHLGTMPEYANFSAEQQQSASSAPIFDASTYGTGYPPTSYFAIPTHQSETCFMDFNMMNSAICELQHNTASTFYPLASNPQFVQPRGYLPPTGSSNGIPFQQGVVRYAPQDLSYSFSIPQDMWALQSGSQNTAQYFQQTEPLYAGPPNLIQPEKELVGMGLYDAPEEIAATGSQFGGNRLSMMSDATHSDGKGLKLEETWQPPGDHGVDDGCGDDESSEEDFDEVSQLVPHPSFMHGMQCDVPVDLSGQSFFFEDEAAVGNEWWYGQLKQPTAHNAGIGYGWLYNDKQV